MKILLLNQCFYPDVASTGQHLTDLAVALTERGHQVTVLASRRGYDDPECRFAGRESWRGIDIMRIPTLGLGKKSRWRRAADFATFLILSFARLMLLPRQDLTVALTSPPLTSFFAALFVRLRGGQLCFWVMDLNPDEAVALGWLRETSLIARSLQWCLRFSLRQSDNIVVLDRFMRDRILAKNVPAKRISIIPPWSHDEDVRYDEGGRAAFRARYGLANKFVVMYSGNHSPCHPLQTLLDAARVLRNELDIIFCFVGGGSEFGKVREFALENGLNNILCLPYQPLSQLSASLSAADVHVVVMGDPFAGLVHPCKVYNIIAIGAPFLYIGPAKSHIVDLLREGNKGVRAWACRHGAVVELATHITAAAALGAARVADAERFSLQWAQRTLIPRFIAVLDRGSYSADSTANNPVVTSSSKAG